MANLKDPVAGIVTELKSVRQLSKDLASRIRSDKPASAVARQLLGQVEHIQAVVADPAMPEAVRTAWAGGARSYGKIALAFGVALPGVTAGQPGP